MKKSSGFALLEIAIAIAVLGIISSFFLMKFTMTNKMLRARTMKSNIETCAIALAAYVSEHYCLPKPSHHIPESEYIGRVPYEILGINEKDTLDGKGKFLTYAVQPRLTSQLNRKIYDDGELGQCFCGNLIAPGLRTETGDQIIAFVIDEGGKIPRIINGEEFIAANNRNTLIVTRDILLMKYLQSPPCRVPIQEKRKIPEAEPENAAPGGADPADL